LTMYAARRGADGIQRVKNAAISGIAKVGLEVRSRGSTPASRCGLPGLRPSTSERGREAPRAASPSQRSIAMDRLVGVARDELLAAEQRLRAAEIAETSAGVHASGIHARILFTDGFPPLVAIVHEHRLLVAMPGGGRTVPVEKI